MHILRNNKGITLLTLMTYIILTLIVLGMLATLTSNFRQNLDNLDETTVKETEADKLNLQLLKEVKNANNQIDEVRSNSTQVVFFDGINENIYEYVSEEQAIILNSSIKIAAQVEECTFTLEKIDNRQQLTVDVRINGKQRTTEYVLSNSL